MPSRPATYAELFKGENRVIRIKSIDAAVLRRNTQFVVSLRHLPSQVMQERPEDGCNIWSRAKSGSYTSVVCMTHFGVGHFSLGIIQSIQKMRRIYKGKEILGP